MGADMTSKTGIFFLTPAAVIMAALLIAPPAYAQASAQSPGQLESAATPPDQVQQAPRPATPPAGVQSPYWTANIGMEADTNDTGYAFAGPFYVRPFRPNMAVVAGGSINYLY